MIHVFSYNERANFFSLYEKMLLSRKIFFESRQEWSQALQITPQEDYYDRNCNPLYVVAIDEETEAVASIRVLPTTGPTMLRQEFACHFRNCPDIISPDVWELSWFCTTADTATRAGQNLMLDVMRAVCDCAMSNGVKQITGTHPHSRLRLYRRLNSLPSVICSAEINGLEFCVGVLDINLLTLRHLTELRFRPF